MIIKNEDETREEVAVCEYKALVLYVEDTDPITRS
jgi:hypothetical protein